MKHITRAAAIFSMIAALAACSSQDTDPAPPASVTITGASVVAQVDGDPYIAMTVTTSTADQLSAAEVDPQTVADSVELTAAGPEPAAPTGGDPAPITPGDPIDSVELAAGQPTTFGPGAYGMWLTEPKKLKKDSTITITLTLKEAGPVVVQAPVR